MTDQEKAYPEDRRYTAEHEWIRVEGNVATVGITEYAQSELGDVVFVELPKRGDALVAGQELGTVESVKTVSDIFAPVSGTVLEINEDLQDSPEKLNLDPYQEGWLIRIEMKDPGEIETLLTPEGYRRQVEAEGDH